MRNRKYTMKNTLLAVCLIAALMVAGCSTSNSSKNSTNNSPSSNTEDTTEVTESTDSKENESWNKEFDHELGTMKLTKKPEVIVAPYLEDALLTLGITPAAKWSYGELVQQYLEPYMTDVPRLDFAGGLNKEALLSFNPDLIVFYTSRMVEDDSYNQYTQISPTYVFDDGTVDWKKTLRLFGEMTDLSDKAEQAIEQYEQKVETAKALIKEEAEGKTFAIIRAKPKEIQLMDGTYYSGPIVYNDLGLTPHRLVKELSFDHAVSLSLELLPELDADYLFMLVQDDNSRKLLDEFQNSNLWKSLPAVKNGNVIEMPANYWMATGAIANTLKIDDVVNALTK